MRWHVQEQNRPGQFVDQYAGARPHVAGAFLTKGVLGDRRVVEVRRLIVLPPNGKDQRGRRLAGIKGVRIAQRLCRELGARQSVSREAVQYGIRTFSQVDGCFRILFREPLEKA